MAGQFEGKVALVTGGNSGIGKATAVAFANEGAKVAIAARREKEGEDVVTKMKKAGGDAIFIKTDVSQPAEVKAMVNATVETYGRLDFAFNNAACVSDGSHIKDLAGEIFDRVIDTNLRGVFHCMKFEIPEMIKVGGGGIVNNSSVAGFSSWAGGAPYSASKHAVNGLTKCAAYEVGEYGIRVNAVLPRIIETPIWDGTLEGEKEKILLKLSPSDG